MNCSFGKYCKSWQACNVTISLGTKIIRLLNAFLLPVSLSSNDVSFTILSYVIMVPNTLYKKLWDSHKNNAVSN